MDATPNTPTLFFSRNALQQIDREASGEHGIPSITLMENASRGAARIILRTHCLAQDGTIVVICGGGNNGGDGYAVARHLCEAGFSVRVVYVALPKSEDTSTNAKKVVDLGIYMEPWSEDSLDGVSLIIDAIFGTGLNRKVEGEYEQAIHQINTNGSPCISLDIPSGLDCDTGLPHGCCVVATLTISFVGMKLGFMSELATFVTGEVVVCDIGCPQELLKKYGTTAKGYDG